MDLRGGSTTRWTVLDADGRPLARVLLPTSFRMHVAERGHAWGVVTDGMGVEYVTWYDLEMGRAASGAGP